MIFDSLRDRMGGQSNMSPQQIAHNPLFTAREKIDLLHQLKAQISEAPADEAKFGFKPEEVDAAIAEVRQGSQDDVGADTVLKGDF
tara:strand:- start:182 stop:439 length:258 start_codon:yes stop_codon:yes gene_type:complete